MNDYKNVTDIESVRQYLKGIKIVAFDFETAPDEQYCDVNKAALDPHKSVGISFPASKGTAVYAGIMQYNGLSADK